MTEMPLEDKSLQAQANNPPADPDVHTQRCQRQRDILPPERLANYTATVVGVGAIGRQVALQLAAIGVASLQLIDHDTVEAVNLGPQGYHLNDIGQPKVKATAALCRQMNPQVQIETRPERFRARGSVGEVVFCCVDQIEIRRVIWRAVQDRVQFFCDGRMAAEVLRVLAVAGETGRSHYPTTLFASGEAYRGSCTARSTIFAANVAAGMMLEQFARWLRGLPVDSDLTLNLLASELTVGAPGAA